MEDELRRYEARFVTVDLCGIVIPLRGGLWLLRERASDKSES